MKISFSLGLKNQVTQGDKYSRYQIEMIKEEAGYAKLVVRCLEALAIAQARFERKYDMTEFALSNSMQSWHESTQSPEIIRAVNASMMHNLNEMKSTHAVLEFRSTFENILTR